MMITQSLQVFYTIQKLTYEKIVILFVSLVALMIISVTIYWNLPIEITRKSDIEKGNKIIQNIKSYENRFGKLPENSDYKTLENLGLPHEDSRVYLDYKTDNKGNFELTYLEGFDGPYLLWNSQEGKWTIDYPKILK